jgi:hypothetical protein
MLDLSYSFSKVRQYVVYRSDWNPKLFWIQLTNRQDLGLLLDLQIHAHVNQALI